MRIPVALAATLAILFRLAGAPVAVAAEGEPPCLGDVKRLCANVPPTGDFVRGCLQAHAGEVSAGCRPHMAALTRDTTTLTTACHADLARHCAGIPIAAGARESCLVQHRDALSTKCRDTLDDQANPQPK